MAKTEFNDSDSSSEDTPLQTNATFLELPPSPPMNSSKSVEASLFKGVSFAPTPPSSPTPDTPSAKLSSIALDTNDAGKSNLDLVQTATELREQVTQLKIDISAERVLRKKKEKNLLKLAKQLNLMSVEIGEKKKHIEQLTSTQTAMETKLESTKQALEVLVSKSEQEHRDHHLEITSLQNSHRSSSRSYDDGIANLVAQHSRQCEELRRQVLTSQLETDKLRIQLANAQMKNNPEKADRIVQRAIRGHESSTANGKSDSKGGLNDKRRGTTGSGVFEFFNSEHFWRMLGIIVVVVILPGIVLAHHFDLLSTDALCAPVMPGTKFHPGSSNGLSFEAPWWVPVPAAKPALFSFVCGKRRRRTKVEWIVGTKAGEAGNKLVVIDLAKGKSKIVVVEKNTVSATVHSNAIGFGNRSGKIEKKKAPWASFG